MHQQSASRFRRLPAFGAGLLTAGAILTGVMAGSPAYAAGDCSLTGPADTNGDGFQDYVAGAPSVSVGGAPRAGEIAVKLGTAADDNQGPQGATTLLSLADVVPTATPGPGDRFGATVVVGHIDGDKCLDAVVAMPGASVGGHAAAGAVVIVFGSPDGLGQGTPSEVITASEAGLGTAPESGAHFGTALALEDDNSSDHVTHLAIGVPGMTVAGQSLAGGVAMLDFDPAGDGSVQAARTITQSSPGVVGASEPLDQFGRALTFGWAGDACASNWCKELIVGVPGENAGAGALVVIDATSTPGTYRTTAWSQNSPGAAGAAEKGDGFASSLAWTSEGERYLAVGVPGEDIGRVKNAGAVQVFEYVRAMSTADDRILGQNTEGVAGAAEAGDRFGSALWMGEISGGGDFGALVVGVPGEDIGTAKDAGMVAYFRFQEPNVGFSDRGISQRTPGVVGTAAAGERFGASLASSGELGSLLVGVPDDVGYPGGVIDTLPWVVVAGESQDNGTAWHPFPSGAQFGTSIGNES